MPPGAQLQEKVTRALVECIQAAAERAAASSAELQRTALALQEEIRAVESSLRSDMRRLQSNLLKWLLAFWLGALFLFAAVLITLLSTRSS
jgi:hypothetical protein